MEGQTAIVVPVPAAQALVSADDGMPAHITVVYPFLPGDRITGATTEKLRNLVAALPELEIEFRRTARFPDALYLKPEPAEPFEALTRLIVEQWPEAPPYGGRFADVIPHLTIASADGIDEHLPLRARLTEVCLYEFGDGRWRLRERFPFARA